MGFPYSSGDLLTASDLNASSGLVLVKSVSIGSGVSSVTVTDAFNSTFDDYLIVVNYTSASANAVMFMQLTGSSSGYKYNTMHTAWNTTLSSAASGSASRWDFCGACSTGGASYSIPVFSPYLTRPTRIGPVSWVDNGSGGIMNGYHTSSTSYTGFSIGPTAGTITGGHVNVYGYNNG